MAPTYVKQKSGGSVFLVILAILTFILIVVFVYYGYQRFASAQNQPVTQGDIADLEARLDLLDARLTDQERAADFETWWSIGKWVLGFGVAGFLAWYWIMKHYEKKNGRLTIEDVVGDGTVWGRGQNELKARFGYDAKWASGSSFQRREGSEDRIIIGTFSRHQLVQGATGWPSAKMYVAVLNTSWDYRIWSEPGMTFNQFMAQLHDWEMNGFSAQKDEEMAGLLKLAEKGKAVSQRDTILDELGYTQGD